MITQLNVSSEKEAALQSGGADRSRAMARPLVAVIIIDDLEFGGAQRQVIELVNSMSRDHVQMHICSLSEYVPMASGLRVSSKCLHVVTRNSKFDFGVVYRVSQLLRRLKADIVHGYLFGAEIVARLAGAMARTPVIIGSERDTGYKLKFRHILAYRLTNLLNDLTIANSNAGARFNSEALRQPMSAYRVIHNGVDTERFQPRDGRGLRKEMGIWDDARVVGMFASFKPQKNHPLLLKAARLVIDQAPRTQFLFVGDELLGGMCDTVEYKRGIHGLMRELKLEDHCIYAGNRKDVEKYYNVCDVTVLPSLHEGTPNVALESMACGVPVIATDVADNKMVIPEGKVGHVVPLGDERTLADRIRRVIENENTRATMSQEARAWILKEFSNQRLAEKTFDVYREAYLRKSGKLPINEKRSR